MMRCQRIRLAVLLLFSCCLLLGSAGCIASQFASHAASLGAGWLLGTMTAPTTTETTCFRNGIEIDCSELMHLQP